MKSAAMDAGKRQPGRLRSAWNVLRGEMTTPTQLRAEWLEYQLAFDGIFDKLNTSLARIAKREQRAVAAKLQAITDEGEPSTTPTGPETTADIKARLRQMVAAQRYGSQ